jgi:hypothetical protein
MSLFKKFLYINFILLLSTNYLCAAEKVAYLDIDFVLTNIKNIAKIKIKKLKI